MDRVKSQRVVGDELKCIGGASLCITNSGMK